MGMITVVDFIKIFIVESRKILSITRIGFDCAICGSAIISPKNGQKKFLSQISKHLLTDTIYGWALIGVYIRHRNGQLQEEMALIQASTIPHPRDRSEEHTSELQSRGQLVCRLLLDKKKTLTDKTTSTLTLIITIFYTNFPTTLI